MSSRTYSPSGGTANTVGPVAAGVFETIGSDASQGL